MSTYLGIFYAFPFNHVTGVVSPPFPNPISTVQSTSPIVTYDWPQSHFIDTFDLPLDNNLSGNRSLNSGVSISLTNNISTNVAVSESVFLYVAGGESLFNNSIGVRVVATFATGNPVLYDMILIPNAKTINQLLSNKAYLIVPIPINPYTPFDMKPRNFIISGSPDPNPPIVNNKGIVNSDVNYYRVLNNGNDRLRSLNITPWILPNGWVSAQGSTSGYVNLNDSELPNDILSRIYLGDINTTQIVRYQYENEFSQNDNNPWVLNINSRTNRYKLSMGLVGFEDLPSTPPNPDGSNTDYNDILIDIIGVTNANIVPFQNRRVIVGSITSNVNVIYSDNNTVWFTNTSGTTGLVLNRIVRGESGRYVAVGNTVTYSDNGQIWNIIPSIIGSYADVTYGDGLFIAITNRNGYIISLDGINFSDIININTQSTVTIIRYGNGYWIAGTQNGQIYYTQNINANPSNWTQSVINQSPNIRLNSVNDMAYGGPVGTWIAVGTGTSAGQRSIVLLFSKDDGRTWTYMNSTNFINNGSLLGSMSIIYANNRFSVVGGGSPDPVVYRSGRDENDDWSRVVLPLSLAEVINYRNEEYLIGGEFSQTDSAILRSIDGVNFQTVDIIDSPISYVTGIA